MLCLLLMDVAFIFETQKDKSKLKAERQAGEDDTKISNQELQFMTQEEVSYADKQSNICCKTVPVYELGRELVDPNPFLTSMTQEYWRVFVYFVASS